MKLRRKSHRTGTVYETLDGKFQVSQEFYAPRRWFVNEVDGQGRLADAEPADGFRTLGEARRHLEREYARAT